MENMTRRQAMIGGGSVVVAASTARARPRHLVSLVNRFYELDDSLTVAILEKDSAEIEARRRLPRPGNSIARWMVRGKDGVDRVTSYLQEALDKVQAQARAGRLKDGEVAFVRRALAEQCDYEAAHAEIWSSLRIAELQERAAVARGRVEACLDEIVHTPASGPAEAVLKLRLGDDLEDFSIRTWSSDWDAAIARVVGAAMDDLARLSSEG